MLNTVFISALSLLQGDNIVLRGPGSNILQGQRNYIEFIETSLLPPGWQKLKDLERVLLMRDVLFKYKFFLIALLFLIKLVLFYNTYQRTTTMMKDNDSIQRGMVENNILDSLNYADNSYKLLEKYLNENMREFSNILVQKYVQNPDIYSWDLEKLKQQFDGCDIYIVDENLEIIRTTFAEDLGLDFKQFPNFAELLRQRMAGDSFHADRMDISTNAPRLKKYSYIPTPDHKYLLELSVDILETNPLMGNLNVFSHADNLIKNYDIVKNISFYKFNETGSEVGIITKGEGTYINTKIPREVKDLVKKAVVSNESIEITVANSEEGDYTQKFIPYLNVTTDNQLDWWNSYVVGLTYDDSMLNGRLLAEKNSFIGKTALIALAFILFTLAMMYLIRRTEQVASCDSLTALPNRRIFGEYFNRVISQRKTEKLAVLFIDLDNFKAINDTYYHETGDAVLKKVAELLQRNLRQGDMVIRAGGDEFLVLLTGITSIRDVESVVQKIVGALEAPLLIDGNTVNVKASIGISIYPDNGVTLRELTQKADDAMYKAKKLIPDALSYAFFQ